MASSAGDRSGADIEEDGEADLEDDRPMSFESLRL